MSAKVGQLHAHVRLLQSFRDVGYHVPIGGQRLIVSVRHLGYGLSMPHYRREKTQFGMYLESWRLDRGLTMAQAAARIGRTKRTWFRWICGETIPSAADLRALSEETGQSAHELWNMATSTDYGGSM